MRDGVRSQDTDRHTPGPQAMAQKALSAPQSPRSNFSNSVRSSANGGLTALSPRLGNNRLLVPGSPHGRSGSAVSGMERGPSRAGSAQNLIPEPPRSRQVCRARRLWRAVERPWRIESGRVVVVEGCGLWGVVFQCTSADVVNEDQPRGIQRRSSSFCHCSPAHPSMALQRALQAPPPPHKQRCVLSVAPPPPPPGGKGGRVSSNILIYTATVVL